MPSTDLEKRLREMHLCSQGRCSETYPCDNLEALTAAARIGAEMEREECATLADACADSLRPCAESVGATLAAQRIRARGDK